MLSSELFWALRQTTGTRNARETTSLSSGSSVGGRAWSRETENEWPCSLFVAIFYEVGSLYFGQETAMSSIGAGVSCLPVMVAVCGSSLCFACFFFAKNVQFFWNNVHKLSIQESHMDLQSVVASYFSIKPERALRPCTPWLWGKYCQVTCRWGFGRVLSLVEWMNTLCIHDS